VSDSRRYRKLSRQLQEKAVGVTPAGFFSEGSAHH
jgi:hypothetical protein